MDKLKPCPFCGEKPLMVHSALNEYHSVAPKIGCSHCRYIIQAPDLAIDMDKSVKENCDFEDSQTISYWNTRPAEDALKKVIAEIAATLAMGADLPEDDIFAMCKDAIGEQAILNRYNEKLRERASKLGTDTDAATKESEVKDEY